MRRDPARQHLTAVVPLVQLPAFHDAETGAELVQKVGAEEPDVPEVVRWLGHRRRTAPVERDLQQGKAARTKDPADLVQRPPEVLDLLDHMLGDHEIERGVLEAAHVGDIELQVDESHVTGVVGVPCTPAVDRDGVPTARPEIALEAGLADRSDLERPPSTAVTKGRRELRDQRAMALQRAALGAVGEAPPSVVAQGGRTTHSTVRDLGDWRHDAKLVAA